MTRRIAIVSIFDLTRVFYEVAEGLVQAGHEIFWLTTNEYWTLWLTQRGVRREDIKQLVYAPSDFLDATTKERLLPDIVTAETAAGLTVNQSLLMDQFVRRKNTPDINEYVYLYYRDIRDFLVEKQVTHVFAEPTNTNEMITCLVCRQLDIPFLSPRDMRYPSRRLVFFGGHRQVAVVPRTRPDETVDGRDLIDAFTVKKPAPYYFKKNSRLSALAPKKLIGAMRHRLSRRHIISGHGLTHHDLRGRIKLARDRTVNGFYMRHLCRYDRLNEISGRIAFYGLHVQPEASIDVLGAYFSDQLKLIKDIRRALPFDVTLVVKEHPNFLGIKPIAFFKELRRIPNVALVKHDVSTFDIYNRAEIIFTVSGTTGYEGGLLGIPVVTFCPLYYDGLSAVHLCTDITTLQTLVGTLPGGFERDIDADATFMARLVSHSFDAFWSDPNLYPFVLDSENMTRLISAFLEMVEPDAG